MPSVHHTDLSKTIADLRKHLLPSKFNQNGNYRDRVFTGVVSFRVLAHAAFEEYLEVRAKEIAIAASKLCKEKGIISHTAACLVAFNENGFGGPPDTLKAQQESQKKAWNERVDMRERVASAATSYVGYLLRENHGIREKNILKILLPIGFPFEHIDEITLAELDNFGRLRGEYAHRATSKHIVNRPNPSEELDRVKSIITMLLKIDKNMDSILKNIK